MKEMQNDGKTWIPGIKYKIVGGIGVDRCMRTYSNQPPIPDESGRPKQILIDKQEKKSPPAQT